MGKIVHGNANFGYAKISNSAGTLSFGTPVMLKGMVSMDIEVEQDSQTIYADNEEYAIVRGAKVRTATGTFRYIDEAYAELLGFKKNTSGMVTDTGKHEDHCIFFETTETDGSEETRTLHYLYSVNGDEPSFSSETDEDEVTPQEIEVGYKCKGSAIALDDEGMKVQYGYITRTEANKTKYDAFLTGVILPK